MPTTEPAVATASQADQVSPNSSDSPRSPYSLTHDFWGGLAAMLVALPSAIAFGVTIYSPLGASYAAQGAIAGILGTIALGIVAATFGGTKRLITSPSAPAVAVLVAFVIEMAGKGIAAPAILLTMSLVAVICGILQIGMGLVGMGRLIKYMPYPVVSGFQSGVGLIIVISQVPKFFGVPAGTTFWHSVLLPSLWKWQSLTVGAVTMAAMLIAPKITKTVPAAILSLLAGVGVYFAIASADRPLLSLVGNKLVIGPLTTSNARFLDTMFSHWRAFSGFGLSQIDLLIYPALTLAVLLSIDTLKTSLVLDTVTRTRHDSNRELIGQGLGNIASTAIGGLPGSGQSGATMINLASGAKTRLSGILEGLFALAAFLLLGKLIAWVPLAAVAGILIIVGVRMFDRHIFDLLKTRTTVLDFAVIVTVVAIAQAVSLIAASAVGICLAILLFLREQSRDMVVRRKSYGYERFSRQMRNAQEMEVLQEYGGRTVIFELQGSLFFGTADQLYTELEKEFKKRTYLVLDMRRVQSIDFTAAHMLELVEDIVAEHNGMVIFSHTPSRAPSGQDMAAYLKQVGLDRKERHARIFPHLDAALEWIEGRTLAEAHVERPPEDPWGLRELDVLKERKAETIAALEASTELRRYKAGETIFTFGAEGDDLYFIRQGSVRITMPLSGRIEHHLSTFGRGDVFGEISFTDRGPRSADAIAETDTEVYVLTHEGFDALMREHHKLALNLLEWLATVMAGRLRRTNTELRYLKES